MALITPGRIQAVYTMLAAFPPFCRWPMPHPALVTFRASDDLTVQGVYRRTTAGRHVIEINRHTVVALAQMIETVAHEMAHPRAGPSAPVRLTHA